MTQIREGGVEIPAGMKRWEGGDTAPDDWDGGRILLKDRIWGVPVDRNWRATVFHRDIIAYTPTPSPEIDEQTMGEAVAWAYELATAIHSDGTYSAFDKKPRVSVDKPVVPEGAIRNLTPLYATPKPADPTSVAGERSEQPMGLWRDEIDKLVEAGFATVSRNPSDHETVLAYRAAIHLALATPKPADPTSEAGERMRLREIAVLVNAGQIEGLTPAAVEALGRADMAGDAAGGDALDCLVAFARGGPMIWRDGSTTDFNALRADILAALATNAPDAAKREGGE